MLETTNVKVKIMFVLSVGIVTVDNSNDCTTRNRDDRTVQASVLLTYSVETLRFTPVLASSHTRSTKYF